MIYILFLLTPFLCYKSEYIPFPWEPVELKHPQPHYYTRAEDLPLSFSWGDVDGTSYLTRVLNQHIPQYCGSCWAHGSMSTLADRIKIQRGHKGTEIHVSIQYILNCGSEVAGSCHGGSGLATFAWIAKTGGIPFETCQIYEACSANSVEGHCRQFAQDYTCKPENICRTCDTYSTEGGKCVGLSKYPKVEVAEYGRVRGVFEMKAEIFHRGPIATGINSEPILDYQGGIFRDEDAGREITHEVSIVGWGFDEDEQVPYWIIRNSWGEYWGEMGFLRVEMGKNILAVEEQAYWVTPKSWTEHNFPCGEGGAGCMVEREYIDPGMDRELIY